MIEATAAIQESDLIESHLYLVAQVVDRMKLRLPAHIDADDLRSVGVLGLIAAVHKFDREKECTFASYAVMRVRGAILDELRRSDTLPRKGRAMAKDLSDARCVVAQRFGREPTDAEVAKQMGVTGERYRKMLLQSEPRKTICFDLPVATESAEGRSAISLHEVIADEGDVTAAEIIESEERAELLARLIGKFEPRTQYIFAMYYEQGMRFSEIAAAFALTESRICQIVNEALKELREKISRSDFR